MTPPAHPADFFAQPRTIQADEMYVASVTYGRMLLFTFESSESMDKLEAAVKYAFRGTGGGNASTQYTKTLNQTKMNVLVLGGAAEDGIQTITNGLDGIKRYIQQGANYSAISPGVPLSYKLRYLSDNAIGNTILSTTFYERQCTKTTGRFKITVTSLSLYCRPR